jgi:hypothetical protein
MATFTYYLTALEQNTATFKVQIEEGTPLRAIRGAVQDGKDLRYSPILPAYLIPEEEPTKPPVTPTSIAFFFASQPYHVLGKLRPGLSEAERHLVFFTQGLASIILINCERDRALAIKEEICCSHMEFWTVEDGLLSHEGVGLIQDPVETDSMSFDLAEVGDDVIDVYVQQISASITSLWASYSRHFPEERKTLTQILEVAKRLVAQYLQLATDTPSLTNLKERNSIISSLVELSASLSYSVTQGTSGCSPILANRSPFPHHSLLGVGGAVRALTKFTRYLEQAFTARSAAAIIEKQYSSKAVVVPASIGAYKSGEPYSFTLPEGHREEFDNGGDFPVDDVPLLAHFSLRHGFKEAKFSITAASESLTAEGLPAWTLMTLSHEIMHSRVRDILWALFGTSWAQQDKSERWDRFYEDFTSWYGSGGKSPIPLNQGIRNAVLNFCMATERATEIVQERRSEEGRKISPDNLLADFLNHRRLAAEIFVHFHDYYFAYARQPRPYIMSLWASWTTVAAPVANPIEYLVRTLATIACGTGAEPEKAFEGAVELLYDGLDYLEASGIQSPLFDELRSLISDDSNGAAYALFKPAYYLIDQVRLNFASSIIAAKIDSIETDPFSEGSTIASLYSASIYVYGETDPRLIVSPIRYSLAALVRQLSGEPPIGDLQWLTAWNDLVISSQEAAK